MGTLALWKLDFFFFPITRKSYKKKKGLKKFCEGVWGVPSGVYERKKE